MGSTWVLSAPDGPHVGPMNIAIRVVSDEANSTKWSSILPKEIGTRHDAVEFHMQ